MFEPRFIDRAGITREWQENRPGLRKGGAQPANSPTFVRMFLWTFSVPLPMSLLFLVSDPARMTGFGEAGVNCLIQIKP